MKRCPLCRLTDLTYDTWEDCYLCHSCGAISYPQDFDEQDNPDAGIRHIGEPSEAGT